MDRIVAEQSLGLTFPYSRAEVIRAFNRAAHRVRAKTGSNLVDRDRLKQDLLPLLEARAVCERVASVSPVSPSGAPVQPTRTASPAVGSQTQPQRVGRPGQAQRPRTPPSRSVPSPVPVIPSQPFPRPVTVPLSSWGGGAAPAYPSPLSGSSPTWSSGQPVYPAWWSWYAFRRWLVWRLMGWVRLLVVVLALILLAVVLHRLYSDQPGDLLTRMGAATSKTKSGKSMPARTPTATRLPTPVPTPAFASVVLDSDLKAVLVVERADESAKLYSQDQNIKVSVDAQGSVRCYSSSRAVVQPGPGSVKLNVLNAAVFERDLSFESDRRYLFEVRKKEWHLVFSVWWGQTQEFFEVIPIPLLSAVSQQDSSAVGPVEGDVENPRSYIERHGQWFPPGRRDLGSVVPRSFEQGPPVDPRSFSHIPEEEPDPVPTEEETDSVPVAEEVVEECRLLGTADEELSCQIVMDSGAYRVSLGPDRVEEFALPVGNARFEVVGGDGIAMRHRTFLEAGVSYELLVHARFHAIELIRKDTARPYSQVAKLHLLRMQRLTGKHGKR